jgi:transcriptional regulator with XRE-family HTH domain
VSRTPEDEQQIKKFGENVRRERMARRITQEKLSEMIGLNIRNLQKIEAGETNVLMKTVVRIRKELGCTADKLLPKD